MAFTCPRCTTPLTPLTTTVPASYIANREAAGLLIEDTIEFAVLSCRCGWWTRYWHRLNELN